LEIAAVELRDRMDDPWLFNLAVISGPPQGAPDAYLRIHEFIANDPELRIFDGGWFSGPSCGRCVDAGPLIRRMCVAAMEGKLDKTFDELDKYLAAKELSCVHRSLISGIRCAERTEFLPGIAFVPTNERYAEDAVLRRLHDAYSDVSAPPLGTLEGEFDFPRLHTVQHDGQPPVAPSLPDSSGLLAAIRATSSQGIHILSSWYVLPDWCPVPHGARTMGTVPHNWDCHDLTAADVVQIRDLVAGYRRLDSKTQAALDLALTRLNQGLGQRGLVDQAIDLRIAYEMLFSIGEKKDDKASSELRFRLAYRVAGLLGTTAQDRRVLFKLARSLYDMCSGAVHSGLVSDDYNNQKGMELLKGGADLVRRAARKIMLDGAPDWTDVLLGKVEA
jgi:hypothetical protein